jgi:hypothetical protein
MRGFVLLRRWGDRRLDPLVLFLWASSTVDGPGRKLSKLPVRNRNIARSEVSSG